MDAILFFEWFYDELCFSYKMASQTVIQMKKGDKTTHVT